MDDKKNYYAIIPANVRYDKSLIPNAKLLYGEITALCNEKGFCWASNKYFSELYDVSTKSISVWINQLKSRGYIKIDIKYKDNSQKIEYRYIKINIDNSENNVIENTKKGGVLEENFRGYGSFLPKPMEEKVKENITYNNITYNNEASPASPPKQKLNTEQLELRKKLMTYFDNKYLVLYSKKISWDGKEIKSVSEIIKKYTPIDIHDKMILLENECKRDPKWNIFLPSCLLSKWNKLVKPPSVYDQIKND